MRPLFVGLLFGLVLIMSLYSFGPRTHLSSEVLGSDSESPNDLRSADALSHNLGANVATSRVTTEDDSPNIHGRTAWSGIVGNVSLLLPGLGCAGSTPPFPVKDITSLVATSKTGEKTLITLWFAGSFNCASFYDIFEARLPAGSYSLTLSYCSQSPLGLGCASLPTVVNVERRAFTFVSMDIVSCINCGSWNVTVKTYPLTPDLQHEFAFVCGSQGLSACTPLSTYLCHYDFDGVDDDHSGTNCSVSLITVTSVSFINATAGTVQLSGPTPNPGSGPTPGPTRPSTESGQPTGNPAQSRRSAQSPGLPPWMYGFLGIVAASIIASGVWVTRRRTKRAPSRVPTEKPTI